MRKVILVSISSGIGDALARRWLSRQWSIAGTYRTASAETHALGELGARLVSCDLGDASSVDRAGDQLGKLMPDWDALIILAGSMEPIGSFMSVAFDAWAQAIEANFTNQLRILHRLFPSRARTSSPLVLYFAGGGTNSAPVNFSAYTAAKIGLIKMCELLDAENSDARFAIVGPGWVRTKIHDETLRAGELAGESLARTQDMLRSGDFTPMSEVLDCCDWLMDAPKVAIGGRNFSVVHDAWGDKRLEEMLGTNSQLYKLRRMGNDAMSRTPKGRP